MSHFADLTERIESSFRDVFSEYLNTENSSLADGHALTYFKNANPWDSAFVDIVVNQIPEDNHKIVSIWQELKYPDPPNMAEISTLIEGIYNAVLYYGLAHLFLTIEDYIKNTEDEHENR